MMFERKQLDKWLLFTYNKKIYRKDEKSAKSKEISLR